MTISAVTTTITIVGISRSLGDVVQGPLRTMGYTRTLPDPPSFDIEIKVEHGEDEATYYIELRVDDEQVNTLWGNLAEAVRDFREEHGLDKEPDPVPNYYGRKIVKLISYDKDVPKAVVEVENPGGGRGQWCALFSALDLYTQRWILNEWWARDESDDLLDSGA